MPSPAEVVTTALKAHGSTTDGTNWQCPVHDDGRPSLKVDAAQGPDGPRALVKCYAGCETEAVVQALGLTMRDLFPEKMPTAEPDHYVYTDADGAPLYRVTRLPGKRFVQARYAQGEPGADAEGYLSGRGCMNGTPRVLYRLPQVVAAVREQRPVYVVEGEKDADALAARGHAATTSPQGAGKWRAVADHAGDILEGAEVVIVQDRDEPGEAHAREVAASLEGRAASVRIVQARKGKDAADHLSAGLDVDAFVEVAGEEPPPEPWAWENAFAQPDEPRKPPELMAGTDGTALIYRGGRVLLSAEPGHGKTWAAAALVAEVIGRGESVLWIDADRFGRGDIVSRLRAFGVSGEDGERLFRYSPALEDVALDEMRGIAERAVADGFALVVLDVWGPALRSAGVDQNDAQEVGGWHKVFTDVLWEAGTTFVVLDHVTKSKERNRRFSIGSAEKLRPMDVHLSVRPAKKEPFGKGQDGAFLLTVEKDRFGGVGVEGSTFRLTMRHENGGITWDVTSGQDGQDRDGLWSPTTIMERVSLLLETSGEMSGSQIRKGTTGKDGGVIQALAVLSAGGWVTTRHGPRGATLYVSARPFREGDELPPGFYRAGD